MQHVADFGLSYATLEEFTLRQQLFNEVDKEIQETNEESMRIGDSLRLGHNFLSTWTKDERKRLLGYRNTGESHGLKQGEVSDYGLPASVNWVTAGGVTPVKD